MSKITIVTAIKLEKKNEKKMISSLEKKYGKDSSIAFKVDEKLISGLQIMLDSKLIDLSFKKKLESIRENLISNF